LNIFLFKTGLKFAGAKQLLIWACNVSLQMDNVTGWLCKRLPKNQFVANTLYQKRYFPQKIAFACIFIAICMALWKKR